MVWLFLSTFLPPVPSALCPSLPLISPLSASLAPPLLVSKMGFMQRWKEWPLARCSAYNKCSVKLAIMTIIWNNKKTIFSFLMDLVLSCIIGQLNWKTLSFSTGIDRLIFSDKDVKQLVHPILCADSAIPGEKVAPSWPGHSPSPSQGWRRSHGCGQVSPRPPWAQ